MQLGLVAANLGIPIVPASAAAIRTRGIVYRPLADLDGDDAIETVLVWRRLDSSPLIQEFLAVAREVLEEWKNTTEGVERG